MIDILNFINKKINNNELKILKLRKQIHDINSRPIMLRPPMNIKNIERDLFELEKKELTKQQQHNIHRVKEHAQHMLIILSKLKPSRELSLAKTKLEECVMWATKSIVFSEEK